MLFLRGSERDQERPEWQETTIKCKDCSRRFSGDCRGNQIKGGGQERTYQGIPDEAY